MGRDWERQKARLHWLQDGEREEEARDLRPRGSSDGADDESEEEGSERKVSMEEEDVASSSLSLLVEEESPGSLRCEVERLLEVDLISMMVLLVKQVHLQKVGAAVEEVRQVSIVSSS